MLVCLIPNSPCTQTFAETGFGGKVPVKHYKSI